MAGRGSAYAESDSALVALTRGGDIEAFAELWRRHYRAAISAARQFTSIDADDLVSEAYLRIFRRATSGGGPTGAFRPYLYTTIRNLASTWGGSAREVAVELMDDYEDDRIPDDPAAWQLDRRMTADAFRSLPERWQTVLWYTEVERMDPHEVAPLLGLTANGVAALAYRAREGLRKAWLQAHVSDATAAAECRWTRARIGDRARDGLGMRERRRVDAHLLDCAGCRSVLDEVEHVGAQLAGSLLPLVLGAAAGGTLLAALGHASPAMAGGLAGGAAAGGVGLGAGAAGAAGALGAGTAAGTTAGASALVGALAVAAVIGGAAVIGIVPTDGQASADPGPSAGQSVDSPGSVPTSGDARGPRGELGGGPGGAPGLPEQLEPSADDRSVGLPQLGDVVDGVTDWVSDSVDSVGDVVDGVAGDVGSIGDALIGTITGDPTPPPGHTAPGGVVGADVALTLTGTATPGAHLSLQAAGQVYATTTVDADGRFTLTVTGLPDAVTGLELVQAVDRSYLADTLGLGGVLGGLLGSVESLVDDLISPLQLDELPAGLSITLLDD